MAIEELETDMISVGTLWPPPLGPGMFGGTLGPPSLEPGKRSMLGLALEVTALEEGSLVVFEAAMAPPLGPDRESVFVALGELKFVGD